MAISEQQFLTGYRVQETKIATWEQFDQEIATLRERYQGHEIFFRGQGNAEWSLDTTLERTVQHPYRVSKYLQEATQHSEEIETFTGTRWNIPDFPRILDQLRGQGHRFRHLPCYEYLVYLRHHGFPSPLLDWTQSPHIATHFALAKPDSGDSAVFCYLEEIGEGKAGTVGEPWIHTHGPYVRSHWRHFAQRAYYTTATFWDPNEQQHCFCNHHHVFAKSEQHQDLLFKIVIPGALKRAGRYRLDDFNINDFTLFQTDDALCKTIATRVFETA